MRSFNQWIEEKKKQDKESSPPTATSSPLRGANQDQSGFSPKNNVADYTISDSKKWAKEEVEQVDEISTELVGKVNKARAFGKPSKTPAAAKTLSNAVKKAWLKSNVGKIKEEVEQVDEVISGVGAVRSTPGNMKGSAHTGTTNAPVSGKNLQAASDRRRIELDKLAQKQREDQENVRKEAEKQREKDKALRDRINKIKEEYINEGRPKKNKTEEDPGSEHVIMQLRKVITTRGMHKVKHVSGETSKVDPAHAHTMLAHHDNLKTAADKQAYATRLHKSASSMKDALSGKPEHKQPKVSLAGKITGTQKG